MADVEKFKILRQRRASFLKYGKVETIYSDLKNCIHIAVRNRPNLAWVLRKYKIYCDLQNYLEYRHV